MLSYDDALTLVAPVYRALTHPATQDVEELLTSCLAEDWLSFDSGDKPTDRPHFIEKVKGFGKAIPDLAFQVQEVVVGEDQIVIRSVASGTPQVPFLGIQPTGKKFRIMTIDIHTVRDGMLVKAHHVEDWMAAAMQLR